MHDTTVGQGGKQDKCVETGFRVVVVAIGGGGGEGR
jgi:hypothetical protein